MSFPPLDPFAVDAVVPVRDGQRYIRDCLDSIMVQTRPVRSVVVVDDGSTDETPDIVDDYRRRWPGLQLVRTRKHGVSHARNIGIANCRAPFVAFLDSDDIWEPTKLDRQMKVFSQAPATVGFVNCSYYPMDEDGRRFERATVEPTNPADLFRALLLEGNIVSGSCSAVVARRDLLARVGGFDETLIFGEDWDLWIKLAEIAELRCVADRLVGIRNPSREHPA